jgi:hypothetical protein
LALDRIALNRVPAAALTPSNRAAATIVTSGDMGDLEEMSRAMALGWA